MVATIYGAADRAYALSPVAVQTSAYTAAANQLVPVDTSGGAVTVTLPTAPPDRTMIGVKLVNSAASPNAVTIAAGAGDVFNRAGGTTSLQMTVLYQGVVAQYSAASAIWYVQADDLPLAQLDSRYVLQSAAPVQWFNVKAAAYGAVGNGVHDDTAAINAAISAAQAAGGGIVYLPGGTYMVTPQSSTTAALVLNNGTTGYKGIRFVGDSSQITIIKRTAAGPILSMSGPAADISGATHCRWCGLENLVLSGNNLTGTLLQTYYADDLSFWNCQFNNSLDVVQDTAEFWDSRYYNCVWNSSGSTTGGTTAPNIWLRNSAATSGFGYSSDTVNNIHFIGCRWEQPLTGAVRIERGLGSNTGQPYSIYFVNNKIETAQINGGPLVYVDTTCRDIRIENLHLYAGGFYTGYSTAVDAITFGPQFGSIRDVLIFNATANACIANGLTLNSPLSKSFVVAERVRGSYTGGATPTGAHINFGTSTGNFHVTDCGADNGTLFGGNVPSNATASILSTNTGSGSFGITNAAAVTGATNADFELVEATSTSNTLGLRVIGDTNNRFTSDASGNLAWGPGNAATDCTFTRSQAGVLQTGQSFRAVNNLIAGGNVRAGSTTTLGSGMVGGIELADVTTSPTGNPTGGVNIYSAAGIIKYKNPQGLLENFGGVIQTTASPVTVANTASASGLQSFSVPANDPVAGAVYVLEGWGVYSDTGTPTLTFALYWGGVAGTVIASIPAITLGSGVSNLPFEYKGTVEWQSTTQCAAVLKLFLGTATSGTMQGYVGTPTAVSTGLATTSAQTLAVAVTWSAASTSNTITLNGGHIRRLA